MRNHAPVLAALAMLSRGAGLEAKLDAVVDQNPLAKRSAIGIHVVSLATHKTLYSRNADRFFLPASNMKLFTTALALTRLGPDHRFTTRLLTDSSGNLVLAGGGDPSLSGREYPYQKNAHAGPPLLAMEQLADEAIRAGLTHVDGDIIGDDTLYPWDPYPPYWTQDDALGEDGAPVSALVVNDNSIALHVHPGAEPGDAASIRFYPALEYFAVDNQVVTSGPKSTRHLQISRIGRQLILTGSIPAGSGTRVETLAVDDPALFAACALYDALASRGVALRGVPVARHRQLGEPYLAPQGQVWASRESPPLSELLQVMSKVSQNLHAEMFLREVARVKGGEATAEAGLKALDGLIHEAGGSLDDARVDDGSGLSRNAQVTPRLVTRLLTHMFASKLSEVWISLLPVGGEDGTLSHRLCCTSQSHNIVAKTGTLNRSVALSGYAESVTYGRLAFSILINNFPAQAKEVQAWVDKIALALTE
jgi:serine-type D-Ala-D-Ala carboxypeptidase/endopeptidase (penicillin-binding protein 4)